VVLNMDAQMMDVMAVNARTVMSDRTLIAPV